MEEGITLSVGVGRGVREAIAGRDVTVEMDWLAGEQAVIIARSVRNDVINFVA